MNEYIEKSVSGGSNPSLSAADIWKKNETIHKIFLHSVALKNQAPAEDDDVPQVQTFDKHRDNQKGRWADKVQTREAAKTMSADMIGGAIDLYVFFKKAQFNSKYKDEVNYALESINALDQAENLVRACVNNLTFPAKLATSSRFKTDLVNYLTDHTIPDHQLPAIEKFQYEGMLREWGDFIFKNKENIQSGNFSFQEHRYVKQITRVINGDGWQYTFNITIEGNTDPEVEKLQEKLKGIVMPPAATIQKKGF